MGLGEGDHRAGLEGDDVDMHVVAQVGRIDEAGRRPAPVRVGHGEAASTSCSLVTKGSGASMPSTAS